ncbi:hypothetical protein BFR40_11980 [Brochothrix thermosphacta]|uniref:hypothetical protein n=1 Tax=Brochothrix thermosphacta TaxID=2756 RepID=UPI00083F7BE4|nr:hypothetical protein [Brochothrix thermosphacta]ODJ49419.1 hypothetical protein BFR40_11980 [Brochothrix thermosphacta]
MTRTYMSIRLSYEAKYWLEKLQGIVQDLLDEQINKDDLKKIENNIKVYLEDKNDSLGGVSITTIFKVSASSIIEKAYEHTKDYTPHQWKQVEQSLSDEIKEIPKNKDVGTLAPRLYLKNEIISGLEKYQKDFMHEDMVRIVKMSYVLKIIICAYYISITK